ncbi:MAG: alginate export family protein [Sphingomonadales bacterium]|nr:alginate export family protein [Sphingomonadales bacterium]
MTPCRLLAAAALAAPLGLAQPAWAKAGDAVIVAEDVTIDPIIDGRLRYEQVDQPATDAHALTMRLRAGAEITSHHLSLLVEGEGTLGLVTDYNAFSFASASHQRRPQFSTVADPNNVELNRLQLQYKLEQGSLTVGRQRINIDDQRWVGASGWRQNEQTFDAVRAEARIGPVSIDGTYAISQRTVFGVDAGPRMAYDGDFVFAGAAVKAGPVTAKAFAYLLDYDEAVVFANSSVTIGGRVTAALPLAPGMKLNLAGSYARQSDYGSAPTPYSADYFALEAALAAKGFVLTGGWESLGSDASAAGGQGRAVQTPLATLHKFNGWADVFPTTPNAGLQDLYFGAAYKFDGVKALPGLNGAVTWHRFRSDVGNVHYGDEWDASLGVKLGRAAILAKYANYDAKAFGVDTEKLWLQVEFAY